MPSTTSSVVSTVCQIRTVDDALIAGPLEGFSDHIAKRGIVGGDAGDRPQPSPP